MNILRALRAAALALLAIPSWAGDFWPAASDWRPDEIGATVRAWHADNQPGRSAHNDKTPGIYALWHLDTVRTVEVKALVTVLRLSNNRDGVGVGLMAEKDITEATSIFASATGMKGYQNTRYAYTPMAGATVECIETCAFKQSTDRWALVPALGVGIRTPLGTRFMDLDISGWTVRLSVQPAPRNKHHHHWHNRPDARPKRSFLLTVGRALP
ncbi:MAG: hypothetical protein LCH79_16565 [Proteobacteria bacterium]|nr:hypothetical protein [Pseudomonadota bacterium]